MQKYHKDFLKYVIASEDECSPTFSEKHHLNSPLSQHCGNQNTTLVKQEDVDYIYQSNYRKLVKPNSNCKTFSSKFLKLQ
jgi:hypothetical protein